MSAGLKVFGHIHLSFEVMTEKVVVNACLLSLVGMPTAFKDPSSWKKMKQSDHFHSQVHARYRCWLVIYSFQTIRVAVNHLSFF